MSGSTVCKTALFCNFLGGQAAAQTSELRDRGGDRGPHGGVEAGVNGEERPVAADRTAGAGAAERRVHAHHDQARAPGANDAAPPRSRVLPVTGAACGVTAAAPLSPEDIALVCDAAGLLHLRWQADLAGERMRALGQAWPHIREAVLHLAGHVSGAKRVAAVVRPALADVVRVYLTDGPAEARDQIAGLCEAACHGRAGSSPARSSGATSSS
jgi:hypothetical protein